MKDNSGFGPRPRLLYVANEDFAFLQHRLPMARAARDAGFEVHVATRVETGRAAIETEGFQVHPMPFRRGGLSPFAALPTVLALRRIERIIRPDIVHHSGLQCCVYGSIAAIGKSLAVVNAITGLGYVFTSRSRKTAALKALIQKLLPALLDRRRSVILVQNPDDAAAVRVLGVKTARIVLIPGSGVDTDVLQPLPEPDGTITIGFVGRLLADKGIRALVTAQALVQQQGHDIRLIIAGNPDPANPASVTVEEARNWNRQRGVEWLGHIGDIAGLWRRCHFAVLPSHREGLPMSLMEAAACGRSMIAADAPGSREIVLHERTGLLVPIEDPKALAAAIIRLADNPELRATYGKAARDLVVAELSATIVREKIGALYREMIAT
jgi:glycosyltransferase involved in cell wall biosynthesis